MNIIDTVYIKTLRNRSANKIQVDVSMVLSYLFTTYGTTETEVLRECKLKIREMAYDLMEPLVTIYDKIEELEHLKIAAVHLYPQSQIVSYGLTIIKNTNNFETGIRTWIIRPAIDHTGTSFKALQGSTSHAKGSMRDDDAIICSPSF